MMQSDVFNPPIDSDCLTKLGGAGYHNVRFLAIGPVCRGDEIRSGDSTPACRATCACCDASSSSARILPISAAGKKTVTAGNVILLFPGTWHRYRPSKKTGWTYYWVHFSGGYPARLVERKFISPENPVLETGLDETIFHSYRCLLDRVRSDPPGLQQLAAANVMEIIGAALAAVRARQSGTELNALVRQAMRLLEQSTEDFVDMEQLAASLNLSYDRFRHVFKRQTGLAPYQYHLQLRINRAKELLTGTPLSIKEIAAALKFESPYHFSSIFKKKTGMPPTRWRGHGEG